MEKPITNRIIAQLNKDPATWLRKRFNSGMSGTKGWPDITGITQISLNGQIFGLRVEIEVKQPNKVPTSIQFNRLRKFRKLGAISFWCDSVESCLEQFEFWRLSFNNINHNFNQSDLYPKKPVFILKDL